MWELDYKEGWALKNWCFWTVVLEKTLESLLDCKEIQPVHPKGDQSWVFFGGTDVEAEAPILRPPDEKSWLIWKDPVAGKDWEQEEKGMTEGEMVGWHHWLDGHGFGWTLGVGDGQGGLACCCSWGRKESDTTEQLNWNELNRVNEFINWQLFTTWLKQENYLTYNWGKSLLLNLDGSKISKWSWREFEKAFKILVHMFSKSQLQMAFLLVHLVRRPLSKKIL